MASLRQIFSDPAYQFGVSIIIGGIAHYIQTTRQLTEVFHEIKSVKEQNVLRAEIVNSLVDKKIDEHEKREEVFLREIDSKITKLTTIVEKLVEKSSFAEQRERPT